MYLPGNSNYANSVPNQFLARWSLMIVIALEIHGLRVTVYSPFGYRGLALKRESNLHVLSRVNDLDPIILAIDWIAQCNIFNHAGDRYFI